MARARLLSVLLERKRTGKGKPAALGHGFSSAAQIPHCHGPRMEPLGPGNLPGSVGQSTTQSGYRKSRRSKATVPGPMRLAHVEDFGHLSLSLCGVMAVAAFLSMPQIAVAAFVLADSRQCDPLPEVPSRARTLPCSGISSAQARIRAGAKIIGRGAVRTSCR